MLAAQCLGRQQAADDGAFDRDDIDKGLAEIAGQKRLGISQVALGREPQLPTWLTKSSSPTLV